MYWLWRSIIISTLVGIGIFLFIVYSETGELPNVRVHNTELISWIFLVNLMGVCFYYLSTFYNTLLPWNKNITARFFLEVSSGLLILGVAALIFSFLFLRDISMADSENTFWQEYWDGGVKFGIISLVIIYIYSLINFSIYSYNQYSRHQIDTLTSERNQINLQFEALKTQLSPHFLFNSLNTISSLIYKDIKIAEDFIRRMAHTYNYILSTNDRQLISLYKELEMVRAYFFMQKIKFENCIELNIDISEETEKSVIPPLTIQMLVENALKHNLICDDKVLKIEIVEEKEKTITVRNNIIQKSELLKIGNNLVDRPKRTGSHKIGLNNIQKRYAYFTNKKIEIIRENIFSVKLPVIFEN